MYDSLGVFVVNQPLIKMILFHGSLCDVYIADDFVHMILSL